MAKNSITRGPMSLILATVLVSCGLQTGTPVTNADQSTPANLSAAPRICQPIAMLPSCFKKSGVFVIEAWDDNPNHCDYKGPLPANYERVDYKLCKDLPGYNPLLGG